MEKGLLHVIAVVSNPVRWKSRIELYKQFEAHMIASGVQLTLVECAFGDRPFELKGNPAVNHVGVRSKTLVWNKENLVNIGISRLPEGWKYVAWIDADIQFRKLDWAYETVHALQQYDIVQPWVQCYDLGANDEHIALHKSFCKIYHDGKPIKQGPQTGPGTGYEFAHPGYAWAATRAFIEQCGGLIETAALGAADHHMALACIGRVMETVPRNMHPNYIQQLKLWEKRALGAAALNVGYVAGTIEHFWHGSKQKRKYVERWEVLTKHQFDPIVDLKKNSHGVIELAGNKPYMRQDMDRYFRQRNEDANCD